jgi:hypothetical protein
MFFLSCFHIFIIKDNYHLKKKKKKNLNATTTLALKFINKKMHTWIIFLFLTLTRFLSSTLEK